MIPAVDPIDVDPIDVGKRMQAHAGNSLGFAVDSTLPASLTAQVAQGLREAIRKGVLKVGEPLPSREALAQRLGVSECVVRAALRDLAADRLVVGKPRRGHVVLAVPQERRARLVLDIETANLGSFCSHISVMACAHAIQRQGHRVLSVVLGTDARETPYLRPLQEALQLRPDMAVVRVASSRRALVTRLLASCGCPYATVTLGKLTRSPGRFAGNLCHNVDDAISDLVAACVRMGVRSALQVDFGVDTYIRADLAFEQAGVFVERLSVPLVGNRSLDDIAQAACAATERRLALGTLPDVFYVSDDYLAQGVCEAFRRRKIACPRDTRLVVYANRGSGLFPFGDLARIEFDPSRDGREIARCVLAWLETGTLGRYDNPHRFVSGRSFLNMPYFGS